MNTTSLKINHMILKGGKLVPRTPTPPNKEKNYCYLPYEPLNRPGPEDYYQETINRLQK